MIESAKSEFRRKASEFRVCWKPVWLIIKMQRKVHLRQIIDCYYWGWFFAWFPIWICLKACLTNYLYFKRPFTLTTWSNKSFLCCNRKAILAHCFCLSLLDRLSLASSKRKCLPLLLHCFLMASRAIIRRAAALKVGLGTGGISSQPSCPVVCSTSTSGWADRRREQTEPMAGW